MKNKCQVCLFLLPVIFLRMFILFDAGFGKIGGDNFFAQAPDSLWTKTFGGMGNENGSEVQQTSDGGYIIVGTTSSHGIGESDLWLVKTNADGDTLWTRTYGGMYNDDGNGVQQTNDGGYIIIGSIGLSESDHSVPWLIKTNADGDTLWTKTYGGDGIGWGGSVLQTTDGGYIIAGSSFDTSGALLRPGTLWLMKTNANGDSLWKKIYGDRRSRVIGGEFVRHTTDGGYIIVSEKIGILDIYFSSDIWLIKTNYIGDTLWTKTYRAKSYSLYPFSFSGSVLQTADSGYIIVGSNTMLHAGYVACFIKTDSNGDTLWTKEYGNGVERGFSVQQTADGGFIFTGSRLFRTDASGDTLWTRNYGGLGRCIQQTTDDGYIITGYKERSDSTYTQTDLWLLRIAPDTAVVSIKISSSNVPASFNLQQNYPNPFNSSTVISYQLPVSRQVELSIYNLLGQKIVTLVSEKQLAGIYKISWDARGLASGVYLYRLEAGEFVQVKKLILMR